MRRWIDIDLCWDVSAVCEESIVDFSPHLNFNCGLYTFIGAAGTVLEALSAGWYILLQTGPIRIVNQ